MSQTKKKPKKTKKQTRKLTSIEDSVNESIRILEDFIKTAKMRNNTDNVRVNRITISRKQKWEEKQLYGYFQR